MRPTMRTTSLASLLLIASALAAVGPRAADEPPAAASIRAEFRDKVRPFLETHCLACHGPEKPRGDLDLSGFTTARIGGPGPPALGTGPGAARSRGHAPGEGEGAPLGRGCGRR